MKKRHNHFAETEVGIYPIKGFIEGWYFRVEEISPGYYRVEGIDRFRHIVSRDGIDPDQILNTLREDIYEKFNM